MSRGPPISSWIRWISSSRPDVDHAEARGHHTLRAGLQPDPAGQLQTLLQLHEIGVGGHVVEGHSLAEPVGLDPPAAVGSHHHPEARHVPVAAHVRPVLLEPAGHEQRLRDDRVEPGLEHEPLVAVVDGLHVVRDLEPALRVQLLLEVERDRRGHVEGESGAGALAAEPAALEDHARGERAGAEHHRVGPHRQAAPVPELGAHALRVRAAHQHLLDAAVGQDPHRVAEAFAAPWAASSRAPRASCRRHSRCCSSRSRGSPRCWPRRG